MNDLLTTSDLKSRGWTARLITTFLSTPDETRPNPKYPTAGSPMKLYRRKRVERMEGSPAFMEARRKAEPRKVAAVNAVRTKRVNTATFVEGLVIVVPQLERDQLIKLARQNQIALELPDTSTERMCVNYLRHCCTPYEKHLAELNGKAGAGSAYFDVKWKVLEAIAEGYDWLADECNRQSDEATRQSDEV